MVLAAVDDVEARLGRTLTTPETARTDPGLLEEASELVLAYLDLDAEPDPVPPAVTIVVSRSVARLLEQASAASDAIPSGAQQQSRTWGPFTEQMTFESGSTSGAPWLTAADKLLLRRYRSGGGVTSVRLGSEHTGSYRTEVPRSWT